MRLRKHSENPDIAALMQRCPSPWAILAGTLPTAIYFISFRLFQFSLTFSGSLALATGILSVWVAARRGNLGAAIAGLILVGVAVLSALITGEIRGYFLPAIILHSIYSATFIGSVLIRRPLAGVVLAVARNQPVPQFIDARRGTFNLLTIIWALKLALVASTLGFLYMSNSLDWLFVAQLALGWPANAVLLVVTMWILIRSRDRN